MWETNVMGLMYMTRAFLPRLVASGDGHIVNIGSIASFETYDGGAGYTAAKHALRAVTETLRIELLGQPVRASEVDPGATETEFSVVRFGGDEARARAVYAGMEPLSADDVAEAVHWATSVPTHVNVNTIELMPVAQSLARFRSPRQLSQPP
jgi:NADP-dependent 3-hydroxy acid dehydrogenase YdfG